MNHKTKTLTLDKALERYTVHGPGEWENATGPKGWYAVSNNDAIIAYFADEADAFMFRLNKINTILNR